MSRPSRARKGEDPTLACPRVRPGDLLILRESNEPVTVLAIVDAAGTLIVRGSDSEFQVARDDVLRPHERHACCEGC